jgi:hypothetical protein
VNISAAVAVAMGRSVAADDGEALRLDDMFLGVLEF